MANIITNIGREFILDYTFTDNVTRPSSVDIGLYNNSVDDLDETSDLPDITTEPVGTEYNRQSNSFLDGFIKEKEGGAWQIRITEKLFEVSDCSQTIDSYFVVINYESDEAEDSSANNHLFFIGNLDDIYDLSAVDNQVLEVSGLRLL